MSSQKMGNPFRVVVFDVGLIRWRRRPSADLPPATFAQAFSLPFPTPSICNASFQFERLVDNRRGQAQRYPRSSEPSTIHSTLMGA